MRLDELVKDMQPDERPPRTLREIYTLEKNPESETHEALRKFYELEPDEKLHP